MSGFGSEAWEASQLRRAMEERQRASVGVRGWWRRLMSDHGDGSSHVWHRKSTWFYTCLLCPEMLDNYPDGPR